MRKLTLFQRIAAAILGLCIYALDFYKIKTYMGLNPGTLVYLVALFFFLIIVYLKEASIIEEISPEYKSRIMVMRLFITTLTVVFCLMEYFKDSNGNSLSSFTFQNISECLLTLFIMIFPDSMMKVLFVFRLKQSNTL